MYFKTIFMIDEKSLTQIATAAAVIYSRYALLIAGIYDFYNFCKAVETFILK